MIKEITFEIKETTGLEDFGGLSKLEDLRNPFIIPAKTTLQDLTVMDH